MKLTQRGTFRIAFTLIELLVTIAIIGIIAGMLLPTLGRAKGKGQRVECLNNVRQLSVAWTVYADERSGLFVNNHGIQETVKRRENWVNNLLDWNYSPDNTNLNSLRSGELCGFLGEATRVFKCPSDRSKAENGPRIRSYSMNSLVGNPGELTNKFNPHLVQFYRMSDVPKPSETYVFLDEHPDTINDGFFMNRWAEYNWGNVPAGYHDGAANLSFVDGHAETHKWVDAETLKPAEKGGTGGVFPAVARNDYDWLRDHSSVPRR